MTGPNLLVLGALAAALAACAPERTGHSSPEMMGGMPAVQRMPDYMMSGEGMMGAGMMQDMRAIHGLLSNHERIERRVEDLPNGVRTVTISQDQQVAELIPTHVRQMKQRYERDQPIRSVDPVFRELFRNREKASLIYEEIPGGLRMTHTSDDPQVVLLIRQHAHRFVSEAAEEGMRRAMRKAPLPEGYRA